MREKIFMKVKAYLIMMQSIELSMEIWTEKCLKNTNISKL